MSDERVERVEHVEHAIRGAIGKMDREWQKKIGGESAGKSRMDDFAYVAARAAVAALDEEPPLEHVLDGICRQLPGRYVGYTIRRRFVLGEWEPYMVFARWTDDDGEYLWEQVGTGATIDAAIRDAVQRAKEQG